MAMGGMCCGLLFCEGGDIIGFGFHEVHERPAALPAWGSEGGGGGARGGGGGGRDSGAVLLAAVDLVFFFFSGFLGWWTTFHPERTGPDEPPDSLDAGWGSEGPDAAPAEDGGAAIGFQDSG